LNRRVLVWTAGVTLAVFSSGCRGGGTVSTKTTVPQSAKPVVRDASREELLDKYNQIAQGTRTVNATVELKPTAGSKYSGLIEEYHEVKAFLLAARPGKIRVIGQAPVIGTTIFSLAVAGRAGDRGRRPTHPAPLDGCYFFYAITFGGFVGLVCPRSKAGPRRYSVQPEPHS